MEKHGLLEWVSRLAAATFLLGAGGAANGQEVENLAAARAGGRLVSFSSQYDEQTWPASHLIDGDAGAGWAGQSSGAQAVVIGFAGDGLVEVHDVLVNPYTREDSSNWVREVEIEASTTYPFAGFETVGRLVLTAEARSHVFSLPAPRQARYVKLVFLRNGGGGYMEAGEVEVMGKAVTGAPAARYREVAAASAGAKIERFTSQYDDSGWAVANLIAEDGRGQWAGSSGSGQEVVIALAEAVEVSHLAIDNYAREDAIHWARNVDVEVSSSSSFKGFQPVGSLSLPQVGGLHTLALEKPTVARYVRLLFRDNHGGSYLETARVRVYSTEGGRPAAVESVTRQLETTGRAVTHEIYFAVDSAEILPSSEAVFGEIAGLLAANPGWKLLIEGHTDGQGTAEHNLGLSRRRAEAVKYWLVDHAGVAEVRLTTVGWGASKPIADDSTEAGRAQNRRVELARQ